MLTVVSYTFPPQVSAISIVMRNLLASYHGEMRAIIGHEFYGTYDPSFTSPCPTKEILFPKLNPRIYHGLRNRYPSLTLALIRNQIQRSIKKIGKTAVLGVFPYDDFFVASFLAAKDLGLPFYAYVQDLWLEAEYRGTPKGRFAAQWEPIILKEATRVICMTEAAQEHYEKKYGIQTNLLPHAIAKVELDHSPLTFSKVNGACYRVVFVGSINAKFNLDALRILAAASELLPESYQLIFSTPADMAKMHKSGIHSSRLQLNYIPRDKIKAFESQAHVLIAPLSHKNCPKDEVRTLFSTKLLSYFLSGRPIIVFAPQDSFHVESARNKGWGYVVTEDSAEALAQAIVTVVENQNLSRHLVDKAFVEAQARCADGYADNLLKWVEHDVKFCAG